MHSRQIEDPFQYLLSQKVSTSHNPQNKYHHNIRLNLQKLPNDFFQPYLQQQHSQRLSNHQPTRAESHQNQFLAYNKTVQLTRSQPQQNRNKKNINRHTIQMNRNSENIRVESKIFGGFTRHLSKQSVDNKRQLTAPHRKRPENRRFTQFLEQPQGFNCTFAKKMFPETKKGNQKRLQFPSLESSRLIQKIKVQTVI